MSAPRQARHAFASGGCLPETLLRCFVAYSEWLVPWWFAENLGLCEPKKVLLDGRHVVPSGELWLFTESAIANVSATVGSGLGVYAAGLSGVEIFGHLSGVERVRVNVNGGPGEELSFNAGFIPTLSRWASAIELERTIHGDALELVLDFQFLVPRFADERFVTKNGEGGFAHPAVVCSAPDARNAFIAGLPELAEQLRWVEMDGRALLAACDEHRLDALYLNPFGPTPQLIDHKRFTSEAGDDVLPCRQIKELKTISRQPHDKSC